jgi:hypothetical protein
MPITRVTTVTSGTFYNVPGELNTNKVKIRRNNNDLGSDFIPANSAVNQRSFAVSIAAADSANEIDVKYTVNPKPGNYKTNICIGLISSTLPGNPLRCFGVVEYQNDHGLEETLFLSHYDFPNNNNPRVYHFPKVPGDSSSAFELTVTPTRNGGNTEFKVTLT